MNACAPASKHETDQELGVPAHPVFRLTSAIPAALVSLTPFAEPSCQRVLTVAPIGAPLFAGVTLLALGLWAGVCCAESASQNGPKPQFGNWGVDLAAMDKSVKPGDDFFAFVNGTWFKNTVVPPNRPYAGVDADIQILTEDRLIGIVAALADKSYGTLSEDRKKLRDFYDAFLDQKAIDAGGLLPAKKDLDLIAELNTHEEVAAAMGRPDLDFARPFDMSIDVDFKNTSRYAVVIGQTDLPMDREYYLKDDADAAKVRAAYRKHLSQMFTLASLSDPDQRAAAVYDLELKLAHAQWSGVENRNPENLYNPMRVGELKSLAPQFPWDDYMGAMEIPLSSPRGERQVIVQQLSAVHKIAKIFGETPVAVWRDYIVVHYLEEYSAILPKAFDDAKFAFFGTVLEGKAEQLPRTRRAAQLLQGEMGFALGKLYVEQYFSPQAQAKIVDLVNNLIKIYEAQIDTLTWMSEATRANALDKLHHIAMQVGYPQHWRDYSALIIRRDDLIGDAKRAKAFEWRRILARLDKPVDRAEWESPPQTVNAEYDPSTNSLRFFAAFLQPPYFDPQADDAVNYGAIGAVIGHEISHAFDDEGSKFDASGALSNWWTPADRQAFDAKAAMLCAQYNTYEPLPGLHVNGALTMGENIADNAGVAIALKAYHLALGGRPAPVIDGYTGDQRFFLAFAQSYRSKQRESLLRQRLLSDVHTPDEYRVIGVTRNQDAWYAAFGVEPGDKYYLPPDRRVHMW